MSKSKMNAIICQALKQLKAEKLGTEKAWFMSLVTLAKFRSELFTAEKIVEVLLIKLFITNINCRTDRCLDPWKFCQILSVYILYY